MTPPAPADQRAADQRPDDARGVVLLVCGGREYGRDPAEAATLARTLDQLHARPDGLREIVHGACRTGADALAHAWAVRHGIPVERFPADWDAHGRQAGPIRNAKMAAYLAFCRDHGRTVGVLAFPGGDGTASMIREAESLGLGVVQVERNGQLRVTTARPTGPAVEPATATLPRPGAR